MNLFGMPVSDDVVAAFLAAAASKQNAEAKKAFRPDASFSKKEPQEDEAKAKKSAETAKKFFDAYVAQGFSHSEAFELTKNNLNTKL